MAYIKLSINPSPTNAYPESVWKLYDKQKDYKSWFSKDPNGFPQRTTEDLSFTPDQVLAYLDLGEFVVTNYQSKLLEALEGKPPK